MTYYDDIAKGYEELHREEQERKIARIKERVQMHEHERLLDVGCGTGITTIPWPCERVGIDPARKLLERAHAREEVSYKLAAAEDIPFPDDSFDWVISITAIQNFSEITKGLDEILRVGKEKFVLSFLKRSKKAQEMRKVFEHASTLLRCLSMSTT